MLIPLFVSVTKPVFSGEPIGFRCSSASQGGLPFLLCSPVDGFPCSTFQPFNSTRLLFLFIPSIAIFAPFLAEAANYRCSEMRFQSAITRQIIVDHALSFHFRVRF